MSSVRKGSALLLMAGFIAAQAFGQAPPQGYPSQPYPPQSYPPQAYPPQPPPPYFPPQQLDGMVSRIALYPDPLIAQVLAAATFWDQIPAAAQYADQHHYLPPDQLAAAIQADQVPWDPSVQALIPFPSVLGMMASDPGWTQQIGSAFLSQQPDVMAAVQRERSLAYRYGYLRSNPQVVVTPGPYIGIAPVNPGFIVVPVYNPGIVFAAPRPGFFVGGAISFGFGVSIGASFRPWGWGYNSINWANRVVIVNNAPWGRTWVNRGAYVHPYAGVRFAARPGPAAVRPGEIRPAIAPRPGEARPAVAPRAAPAYNEQHRLEGRSPAERKAPRDGKAAPKEEHERDDRR